MQYEFKKARNVRLLVVCGVLVGLALVVGGVSLAS